VHKCSGLYVVRYGDHHPQPFDAASLARISARRARHPPSQFPCAGDQRLRAADSPEPRQALPGAEAARESALVHDLLSAFMGLEADHLELSKAQGPGKHTHLVYMLPPKLARACSDVLCSKLSPCAPRPRANLVNKTGMQYTLVPVIQFPSPLLCRGRVSRARVGLCASVSRPDVHAGQQQSYGPISASSRAGRVRG
jgi:hypothetical protein